MSKPFDGERLLQQIAYVEAVERAHAACPPCSDPSCGLVRPCTDLCEVCECCGDYHLEVWAQIDSGDERLQEQSLAVQILKASPQWRLVTE